MATQCFLLLALVSLCLKTSSSQSVWGVHGSGSEVTAPEMAQVAMTMSSTGKPLVFASYRAIGTTAASNEFSTAVPSTHYAIVGLPMNNSITLGGVLTIPMMISKISLFHSVLSMNNTYQVLNLTACTVARILTLQIRTWDDAEIKSSNPNIAVARGTPIVVLRRAAGFSPTTAALLGWVSASCPAQWTQGSDPRLVTWHPATRTVGLDADMISALSDTMGSNSYVPNAIGYIDTALGYQPQNALHPVAIQLGTNANSTFTIATPAHDMAYTSSLTLNPFPAINADWSNFSLQSVLTTGNVSVWPMFLCPMLLLRADSTFMGNESGLLAALATLVLRDDLQKTVVAAGHVSLPATIRMAFNASLGLLQVAPTAPTWSFETSVPAVSGQADFVFSSFRESGLSLAMQQYTALESNFMLMSTKIQDIYSNLSIAQSVRQALQDANDMNNVNQVKINQSFQIAVAGVVISVLLAFTALVLAAIYVGKLKKVDAKYAKYISLQQMKGPGGAGEDGF